MAHDEPPPAAEPVEAPGPRDGPPTVVHGATPPSGARTVPLQREATLAGRLLIIGLATLGVVWLVLQVRFVAAATVLGVAQVAMLWPIARRLRERGLPPVVAALVCVAAYLAFFVSLLVFLVVQLVSSWPGLVDAGMDAVDALADRAQELADRRGTTALDQVIDQLESSLSGALSGLGAAAAQGLSAAGNIVTVLVIALFFTLFALTSGDRLWQRFVGALPSQHRGPSDAAFRAGMRTAGAWFYASTATGLVDGVLIGLGLWALGVPLALPIGALTFLLGYVPLIGATIAGAVAVAVAGVTGGWTTAVWALLLVILVQQIEGNVLSPLLLSRAIHFHPLVVLLLTTGAASAFGLLGLFIAVPVAGVLAAGVQAWRAAVRGAPPLSAPAES